MAATRQSPAKLAGLPSRRVVFDLDLYTSAQGIFRVGIDPAGGGFVEIVFTAVLTNIGGYIPQDNYGPFPLQGYGGKSGVGFAGLADRASHDFLGILKVSSQMAGSGR
jgi:hypothetical protein